MFLAGGNDYSNTMDITVPNLAYTCKPVEPHLDGKPFIQPVNAFGLKSASPFITAAVRNSKLTVY